MLTLYGGTRDDRSVVTANDLQDENGSGWGGNRKMDTAYRQQTYSLAP